MLEHGGRLRDAACRYGIALDDWLDLSAAINPQGFAPPAISPSAWQRLPEDGDGLEAAAAAYYGNPNLLPLPGSQAAIQALPQCFAPHRVAVLSPSYNEHAHAWRGAGHEVLAVMAHELESAAGDCGTLVLCNPNNPDASRLSRERLLALIASGVRLVIDEAFVDALPEYALTPMAGGEVSNLIVLRSLGKFFGLAGARVGFIFAAPELLARLREHIGPWALSGPSRFVATAALNDRDWQQQTRTRLARDGARLAALLAPLGDARSHPLFAYAPRADAMHCADFLARRGILVRHFDAALRFGLPGAEPEWRRLAAAVSEFSDSFPL